jgi:hypothetical protein
MQSEMNKDFFLYRDSVLEAMVGCWIGMFESVLITSSLVFNYLENPYNLGRKCTWYKIRVSFLSTTIVRNIFLVDKYWARCAQISMEIFM